MGKSLSLLVGLLLYLFDYGSDIYVAYQYWKNDDFWWFRMTVGFIAIPSLIVNITAIIQLVNFFTCLAAVLQLSIVVRYFEALALPEHRRIYLLAKLRYLETITESALQWCLQVYIMLRQWNFPWYIVVSSVFSLLSLAWSITALEKERATDEHREFGSCKTIWFPMAQLFVLISRLSAIVLFAYVFRYYVILFLAAHWLLLVVIIFLIQRRFGKSFGDSLLLSLLAAFPYLFHVSETVIPTRNPKVEMTIGYILFVALNIIMATLPLALTIEMLDVPHMDVLQPVAISCLAGASVLPFIVALIEAPKMGKNLKRWILLVGLVLYLFDYGSDIYVAIQYWKNDDFWWFRMTVGFIIIPSLIVNITAIVQLVNVRTCLAAVLQLSIVVRYVEALVLLKHERIYLVAKLRYLETIMESAPQWCLQVYIMLRQWHFPSYIVVSSVFSLLSLAWSITTLEKERATDEGREFGSCKTIWFLMAQLFVLISRLPAIVLVAYVFRYYVILFLAAHWLLLVVIIFLIQICDGESFGISLLLSLLTAFPYLFHASKTVIPTGNPKLEMTIGYLLLLAINIAMVTLSLTIEMPYVPHMDVLPPIVIICALGGSILSLCLAL